MGIKSFFQSIGRGIKRGFNNFVAGAGNIIGGAGTFLQRKAIPALASITGKIAGGIGKALPAIEGIAPELAGPAAEAQNVLSKVSGGVGQFAKYIGSDLPTGPSKVASAQQQADFAKSPLGLAFKRSQTKTQPAPVDASAIRPAVMPANPNPLKMAGAVKAPIGSNPASYSPVKASDIEAKPAGQSSIQVAGGGGGAPMMSM